MFCISNCTETASGLRHYGIKSAAVHKSDLFRGFWAVLCSGLPDYITELLSHCAGHSQIDISGFQEFYGKEM